MAVASGDLGSSLSTLFSAHAKILDGNRRRKGNQRGDFLLFSFRRLCRCETNTEFMLPVVILLDRDILLRTEPLHR